MTRSILCFMAILTLFASALSAQNLDELARELRKPVSMQMKDGRNFEGRATDITSTGFTLKAYQGGGEVEYSINADEINFILFPGQRYANNIGSLVTAGKKSEAMEVYHLFYNQQSKYFQFLHPKQIAFFVNYVSLSLETGDPSRAIAVAKTIIPHLENPKTIELLNDSILLAYHKAKLPEKTLELAKNWLAGAGRYNNTATGWWILSEMKYMEEDYKGALWTSLYPVVYSSQIPMPHLDRCYVIAIASSLALEDDNHARALFKEMGSRHIKWPDDMESFDDIKARLANTTEAESPTADSVDEEAEVEPEKKSLIERKREQNSDLPTRTF